MVVKTFPMVHARAAIALDPRLFGRGPSRAFDQAQHGPALAADIRLFAATFVAGFLFVSILVA